MRQFSMVCLLVAGTCLSACSEKQVSDLLKGKFEKYADCRKKSKELNIDDTASKIYCTASFESEASTDIISSGSSGTPKYCSNTCSAFGGFLYNSSKKTMITHLKISVRSSPNQKLFDSVEYDGLELMPSSTKEFYIQLKNVQVLNEAAGTTHQYDWTIDEVRGIKFDF